MRITWNTTLYLLFLKKAENLKMSLLQNSMWRFKYKDYCPIEIIKGLTDKGQFQYLTKLMGPQEGTYLYATQLYSLR